MKIKMKINKWDLTKLKRFCTGLPWGAVVEGLPANAGDAGSSPGLGGSRMPRSSWAHEPQLLSLRAWSLWSATREDSVVRGPRTAMKSGPRLPQLEKALAQKRRPNTAINKINKLKKKKRFCTAKEVINKSKRQPSEWEKIFANKATDKGLNSQIYRQLMQFNIKKQTNKKPNKKMGGRTM